ncbi:MAG: toll/interleukin-1 receptor domain-containing protein [Bryobacteraceae bacterium]
MIGEEVATEPSPQPAKAPIFLSYSWGDRERVTQTYDLLKAAGAQPWIDRNEICGGAEWELSIRQQMRNTERVVIFLSCSGVQRAGFAWAEIRMAA